MSTLQTMVPRADEKESEEVDTTPKKVRHSHAQIIGVTLLATAAFLAAYIGRDANRSLAVGDQLGFVSKRKEVEASCDGHEMADAYVSCGNCKALVATFGRTCRQYCHEQSLVCVDGWEDKNNTCESKKHMGCDHIVKNRGTSDTICECEPKPKPALPPLPKPHHVTAKPRAMPPRAMPPKAMPSPDAEKWRLAMEKAMRDAKAEREGIPHTLEARCFERGFEAGFVAGHKQGIMHTQISLEDMIQDEEQRIEDEFATMPPSGGIPRGRALAD